MMEILGNLIKSFVYTVIHTNFIIPIVSIILMEAKVNLMCYQFVGYIVSDQLKQ